MINLIKASLVASTLFLSTTSIDDDCWYKQINTCIPQKIHCKETNPELDAYQAAKSYLSVYRLECNSPECQALREEWLQYLEQDRLDYHNHFCDCYTTFCCYPDEERILKLSNCFNGWENTYTIIFDNYIDSFKMLMDACCANPN